MRIPSGVNDQYIYFMAVDATDFVTPETGLATFTVYRSRNGGSAAAYTTPTVSEISSANMPGLYRLLLDEDVTLDAGDGTQEVALRITHAGMAPVTRVIELYRPETTVGETLTVAAGIGESNVVAMAANVMTAAALATDAVTEIVTAVWAAATRVLTAGTNIILAKGVGVTGFNDLSAAQVNAEVDTALADYDAPTNAEMVARTVTSATYATAANLATVDGVVDAIKLKTDNLPSDPADHSVVVAATDAILAAVGTVDTVVDAIQLQTDLLPADPASQSGVEAAISAGGDPSVVAAAVVDSVVDGALTLKQSLALQNSALFGKSLGMNTGTITFRDVADTKDRITGSGDQYGNRDNVVVDGS